VGGVLVSADNGFETQTSEVSETSGVSNDFKQTKIGPIPVEWEVVHLGDVFEIKQGKALSRKKDKGISPYLFLRTANVLWGRIDLSTVDQMDFTQEEVEKFALKPGDMLVCEGGEIGRTAIWQSESGTYCYQNHLHRLRPTQQDIEPLFYVYWMQAAFLILNLYQGTANVTTIANLSRSRLSQLLLPKPSLPEQRRIAHVLSTIQREIAAQDALIAAAREVKRSLMQRLFTYGPGVEPAPTKETEIGEIPEHWEVVRLGEVAKIRYGLGQPPQQDETGVPMIRATNIKRGRIFSEELLRIQVDSIPRTRDPFLKAGDIIVVRSGAYTGDVAMITREWGGCIAGYDLIVSPSNQIASAFCAQYLLGDQAQTYFKSQSTRSAQSHINSHELAATLIPFPALSEQHAITHILSTVDRKIAVEENRKAALQALFKSMLHQLMTGQLRLTQDLETQRRKEAHKLLRTSASLRLCAFAPFVLYLMISNAPSGLQEMKLW
jgi:type I restriction enzyme S subunit